MVTVSVLMLNWNTSSHTIECLKSFENQTFKDFEIIVVDNGSTREDYLRLKQGISKVKCKIILKRLEKNSGITGGMNFGYKFLKGDYIIFMNNDMIVTKSFLKEILAPFDRHQDVGAIVPKVKFWNNGPTDEVQFSGGKLTFYGTLINKGMEKYGSRVYNREDEVDCATAACFLVTRRALDKIGEVFPQFYSVYFEDIDLSWRVKSEGFKIIYAPKSVVYHKGSVSINFNKASVGKYKFITRNKYLTFWRNLAVHEFAIVFPFLVAFDVLKAAKQLARGNIDYCTSSFKGFVDFLDSTDKVKTPRKGRLTDLGWEFEGIESVSSSWSKR
jgi:GT2 family glycosyltransferase